MPEKRKIMNKWTRVMYQPNMPLKEGRYVTASKEHIALSKEAAKEGMVLLKNDNQLLPLRAGSKVALFGKGSFDYVKGGGGSGDVTVSHVHNLYDGLKMQNDMVSIYEPLSDFYRQNVKEQYEKGAAPGMTVEPEVSQELIKGAKAYADTAIITISRFSGEGWDRSSVEYNGEYNPWETETSMPQIAGQIFEDGDFYLTKAEKAMVSQVRESFENIVVVLNIGGIIDSAWFKEDEKLSSVLVAWQGGMEGGMAAAEILCGKASPSGKLPDTFAERLEDYPSTENFHESPHYVDYTEDIYVGYRYFETIPGAYEKVNYPFGFGLSYTDFRIAVLEAGQKEDQIQILARVTNIGRKEGKQVVQVYFQAPQGRLGKPSKVLAAYEKTRALKPGESQVLALSFDIASMASYDDLGKVCQSAYVLEPGAYGFYVGSSIRDVEKLDYSYDLKETVITEQLSSQAAPCRLTRRLLADGSYESLPLRELHEEEGLPRQDKNMLEGYLPGVRERKSMSFAQLAGSRRPRLLDVAEGKITLDELIVQISDEDLIHLLGGQPNTGVANTFGMGNLPEYGVPNVMTADGPAGLRINPECGIHTTAFPCATLIACTWDPQLAEEIGAAAAAELKENNIGVWLAPAVNIHRSPLCGRNFEYYSEDPLVAGKTGAAMIRGIQSLHIGACAKHFACNNKETNRKDSDSRVSERALREIYLKAFEIIVKEADPYMIMTSYNLINGVQASENKELLTGILRGEWGYRGMVTTDWWTHGEHYRETKAGNDVKMGNGYPERVKEALEKGYISREEIAACAKRVLEMVLKMD